MGSGEESEGEEGGGEEGRGQSLAVQQHQLEAEKEALLHNTGLVQEVRELGGVVYSGVVTAWVIHA